MLETLRQATKTWIVKLLLGIVALSFVAFGGDFISGGLFGRGPAIEVGGTEIPAAEVNNEFKRAVDRLQPMFGGKLTADDARKMGILDRTIDQIVTRSLIDEAGRRLGLIASEEAVVAQIAADPTFKNELGQFDRDRLRAALGRIGMSEAELVRMERQNLVRGQIGDALSGGVAAPAALVDQLVRQ
ncbi:MAG TPA: SurA N-terminal domain-containing protein, partial [Candidatus Omnitrophota bacterium]|nr:SurA N-terminal domain-containing protein [Candidatus Omnitrophota bacterium]